MSVPKQKRSITKKRSVQKKKDREKKNRYSKIIFSKRESSVPYRTPKDVLDELQKEFHFTAKYDTKNALNMDDWGQRIFVNTPFRDPNVWVEKGLSEMEKGHTQLAVYLLKADISTALFHDLILPKAKEIRAVRGRLSFSGKGNSPFGSLIAIFKGKGKSKTKPRKKKIENSIAEKERKISEPEAMSA